MSRSHLREKGKDKSSARVSGVADHEGGKDFGSEKGPFVSGEFCIGPCAFPRPRRTSLDAAQASYLLRSMRTGPSLRKKRLLRKRRRAVHSAIDGAQSPELTADPALPRESYRFITLLT